MRHQPCQCIIGRYYTNIELLHKYLCMQANGAILIFLYKRKIWTRPFTKIIRYLVKYDGIIKHVQYFILCTPLEIVFQEQSLIVFLKSPLRTEFRKFKFNCLFKKQIYIEHQNLLTACTWSRLICYLVVIQFLSFFFSLWLKIVMVMEFGGN